MLLVYGHYTDEGLLRPFGRYSYFTDFQNSQFKNYNYQKSKIVGAYVTNQKTSLHWLWLNFVLSYCHVLNLEDIAFYHVNFIHCICLRMHDHSFYFFNNIINNINYRSTLAGQVVLDIKISTFSAIVLNSIYYI